MCKKQYNFRFDTNTMYKIEYIANEEERNITQQILYILKKYIREYELEHGTIPKPENRGTQE